MYHAINRIIHTTTFLRPVVGNLLEQENPMLGPLRIFNHATQTPLASTLTTELGRKKEMFYLMTYSTHLIIVMSVLDIWLMTIQINERKYDGVARTTLL